MQTEDLVRFATTAAGYFIGMALFNKFSDIREARREQEAEAHTHHLMPTEK